ncbi:hypothetical protein B0G62_103159 [Paraburkholderia eburnea]|uniref:DUF6708 domain-containing protein n=1 Tax=Paraburkholderia eburnea TaxID=1189126 RepID=A0A2S4MGN5_9BURK|nr:DUF6708 domain-containing protein [Paraburkholderia eburnea]POR53587.1 hypothetical protein B0G62_103159 [Paraburkholderia eburnea]PRZ25555.1 hypothetical protein BX588_102159 [Paraburkholderia eburnea]
MYTGWIRSFPVDRTLSAQERQESLPHETQADIEPGQHISLIHINSTYIDWIDRRFRFRGMLNTFVATLGCIFIAGSGIYAAYVLLRLIPEAGQDLWTNVACAVAISIFGFGISYLLYYFTIRYDYFTYTHYPIRFNRKTRMVHVFRHNGPGGVLSVPWESMYFHIGRGTDMKFLRDIRGEVLDGEVVKDTFALGHAAESEPPVREMWEFIRRYMDEGPDAVVDSPMAKYVALSVTPTLKNSMLFAVNFTSATTTLRRVLLSPFIALFTATRWLVFRTCKEPVFSPEIEATCQVAADDPNVWPVPESTGQFAADIPGVLEYAEAKARRRWEKERAREQSLRQ